MSDQKETPSRKPTFPVYLDFMVRAGGVLALFGVAYVGAILYYGIHPQAMDIGYQPEQPVPYSHALHAGELGIDCRYCHTTVEESAVASIPPTQTCVNCHTAVHPESDKLLPIRESYASGRPVEWIRVHDLPGFVYFDHSAHVRRGVGCVECHGRVDRMETVYQDKALSMAWCIACHRAPDAHLRPLDQITNMSWEPDGDREELGRSLRLAYNINPSTDCSTCHR